MKGNPIKMGTMKGTAGYKSALKQISNPDTQLGGYTKSQKNRAFGEDVDPREGAKTLKTSVWNYHRMKKKWQKRQEEQPEIKETPSDKSKEEVKEEETSTNDNIITTHDDDYDYKFENGVYLTKRKDSENWITPKENIQKVIAEKVFGIEEEVTEEKPKKEQLGPTVEKAEELLQQQETDPTDASYYPPMQEQLERLVNVTNKTAEINKMELSDFIGQTVEFDQGGSWEVNTKGEVVRTDQQQFMPTTQAQGERVLNTLKEQLKKAL